jgi:hypothetical protein
MSEDKPEIKPEPDKPETKPEPQQPQPKSEFDNPPVKSEFDQPVIKPRKEPVIKPKFKKERQSVGIRFRFKFISVIILLSLGIYFGTVPLIESVAKLLITRIFVDSTISIGGISIKPTRQISFLNVKISKAKLYDIVIQEADLDFTFPSLFKKVLPELTLKDVKFNANSPDTQLTDLVKSIKLSTLKKAPSKIKEEASSQNKGKAAVKAKAKTKAKTEEPAPLISKLDIPDLNLELNIKDAKASGVVSLSLNLLDKKLSFLNITAKRLSAGKVSLEDVDLNALQGQRGKGMLVIRQANLGNLKIKNINSKAVLEGLILSLDDISGVLLSKRIAGEMTLNLWPIVETTINAKSAGISAPGLVKELGWENRLILSGKLYSKAIFRSEGTGMAMLSLNFITTPAGATLTISDSKILKQLSKQSRQSLAKVSESFTDYRFERGQLRASLLENMLSCEIILDGQQGRRNLKFDFKEANIFGAN